MVIDRHIRCIRVVNNNRYMYRKISSTYAHSYKILLFDSQNFAFSQIHAHTQPTKQSPYIRVPRNISHSRYIAALSAYIQRRTPCNFILSRKKETFYHIAYMRIYNNRVGNGFTPATDAICRLLEEAFDWVYKRDPLIYSFSRKSKNVSV